MSSNHPVTQNDYPDEIDLFELFQTLWSQKWAILLVAALVTLGAAAYAFTATPEYEVENVLQPVRIKELNQLNSSDVYELSPGEALGNVFNRLSSYETRLAFYKDNPELFGDLFQSEAPLEQMLESFDRSSIKVTRSDEEGSGPDSVTVKLRYPEGVDGASVVNGLVAYALAAEKAEVIADVQALIDGRLTLLERELNAARTAYEADIEAEIAQLSEADWLKRAQLQDELTALREKLRVQREARIARLEEAYRIAEDLGLTKPTTPFELERPSAGGGSVSIANVTQQIPLYFLGTEALAAEREALLAREVDDFTDPRIAEITQELHLLENNRRIETLLSRENEELFMSKQAELRAQQAQLQALQPEVLAFSLARVDQVAVEPLSPVAPRKALILALGAVLGLMLGVLVGFVRGMVAQRAAALAASNAEQTADVRHLAPKERPVLAPSAEEGGFTHAAGTR